MDAMETALSTSTEYHESELTVLRDKYFQGASLAKKRKLLTDDALSLILLDTVNTFSKILRNCMAQDGRNFKYLNAEAILHDGLLHDLKHAHQAQRVFERLVDLWKEQKNNIVLPCHYYTYVPTHDNQIQFTAHGTLRQEVLVEAQANRFMFDDNLKKCHDIETLMKTIVTCHTFLVRDTCEHLASNEFDMYERAILEQCNCENFQMLIQQYRYTVPPPHETAVETLHELYDFCAENLAQRKWQNVLFENLPIAATCKSAPEDASYGILAAYTTDAGSLAALKLKPDYVTLGLEGISNEILTAADMDDMNRSIFDIGMPGSATMMHIKEGFSVAINTILEGAPKMWLCVPRRNNEKLNDVFVQNESKIMYPANARCPHIFRHKNFFLTPAFLRANSIDHYIFLQPPGTTVILRENVIHQVINLGYNLSESANLLTHESNFVHVRGYTPECHCKNAVIMKAPIPFAYSVVPRKSMITCKICKLHFHCKQTMYTHYTRIHRNSTLPIKCNRKGCNVVLPCNEHRKHVAQQHSYKLPSNVACCICLRSLIGLDKHMKLAHKIGITPTALLLQPLFVKMYNQILVTTPMRQTLTQKFLEAAGAPGLDTETILRERTANFLFLLRHMLCQPSDLLPTTANNTAFPRYCITHNGEIILQRTWPHQVTVDRFEEYTNHILLDPTTKRRTFCFNVWYDALNLPSFSQIIQLATVDAAAAAPETPPAPPPLEDDDTRASSEASCESDNALHISVDADVHTHNTLMPIAALPSPAASSIPLLASTTGSSPQSAGSTRDNNDVAPAKSGATIQNNRARTTFPAATSICPSCKKTLKVDIFPQHIKTCTGSVCPECAATFYNKYSMQRHIKSKHSKKIHSPSQRCNRGGH